MGSSSTLTLNFIETKKGSALILAAIYMIGVLATVLLISNHTYGPSHFNDEVLYWDTTRQLYSGEYTVANQHHYPPFYPIAILPAFLLFPAAKVYSAAKILNVLYLTSAVFPAYLLMRAFANRATSLLVAGLILFLPAQTTITRSMISENVFYPLLLWAILLAFTRITAPGSRWRWIENIVFGLLCGLLVLTRYIALAVVPALLLIWWLKPLDQEKLPLLLSTKKLLHAASVAVPLALVIGAWLLLGLRENVPVKEMLGFGIAANPNPAQLGRRRLLMWAVFYLSYAVLMAAPFLGILTAALFQLRLKDWQKDINRWFIAVALICLFFLIPCIRHSWRAAYNYPDPIKIQGRYIMYFTPLFLITMFAALKQINFPRLSRPSFWLLAVLTIEVIAAADAILFYGFIYLDKPLTISVNSAEGYVFRELGLIYLAVSALILLVSIYGLGRKPRLLLLALPILLAGFYLAGNARVYQNVLYPRQATDYQAHLLVRAIDERYGAGSGVRQSQVILRIPATTDNSVYENWTWTLAMNGFSQVKLAQDEQLPADGPTIFEAQVGNDRFTLRQQVQGAGEQAFSYNGKSYILDSPAQ